jgi:hypothetical protein
MPVLYKPFQRTDTKEILPNSFHESSIILSPKPGKDKTVTGKPIDQYS